MLLLLPPAAGAPRPPKPLSAPQRAAVLLLAAVQIAVTLVIFSRKPFFESMHIFSYVSLLVVALCYCVCIAALWSAAAARVWALWVAPLQIELGIIVAIALNIIVWADGSIYTRNMHPEAANWPDAFGMTHLQDWMVHSWPGMAQLVLLLATHRLVRSAVGAAWEAWTWRRRAAYGAYVVVAGMLPLYTYALSIDEWKTRYAARVDSVAGWLVLSLVGYTIGACLLVFVLPRAKRPQRAPQRVVRGWSSALDLNP